MPHRLFGFSDFHYLANSFDSDCSGDKAKWQNNDRNLQPEWYTVLHTPPVVRTTRVLQRNIYRLINRFLVRAGTFVLPGRVEEWTTMRVCY